MKWIPVKEELPYVEPRIREFKPCLVVNDGNVQWALFNGKIKRFLDSKYHDIHIQVTHWMPLPSPPQVPDHIPEKEKKYELGFVMRPVGAPSGKVFRLGHCKEKKYNEKLPIGLMPRKIHREHRFYDVCDAISRYYNANLQIPIEWIEEYNELLEVLNNENCL